MKVSPCLATSKIGERTIVLLQPITAGNDLDRARVRSWLDAEHVSRWWGDAEQRLRQFDETPANSHAMIVQDATPVGYIRWEVVDTEALQSAGLDDIPPRSIDVDLFIGDPHLTGQDIGPQAVRLLCDHLRRTTDAPLVGLCTSVDNRPAQSAFRKAGCELMTSYDDPTFGPCQVYVRWLR